MSHLFAALNIEYVDHYAVTCRDLNRTLTDYLSINGSRLIRGPGENHAQDVRYAFVDLPGAGTIEILAPLSANSPINGHISSGGGAYHLCYAVNDIDQAIIAAQTCQAKVIVEPRADDAFDGRKVAFLIHEDHGLFELLEAKPAQLQVQASTICTVKVPVQKTAIHCDNERLLLKIYNQLFDTQETDISNAKMDAQPQWDSFKHLVLTMEVEKAFDINIGTTELANITELTQFKHYLKNHDK
ncbi:VOC family protein [Shewanella maritima]|uniref:VOC family protein n=1 Tax=Shewanella maritima TaxID=2520507 RepID=UPI003737035C